ncbi:MAG: hypothetical protein ACLGIJ_08220 [Candidatus Limnocylindria bacterium]
MLAGSLAAIAAAGRVEVVAAECDGPYPSFTNAAPTASRVLIGQVVAIDPGPDAPPDEAGRTSRFFLRGWSVLEDDRIVEERFEDVQSQPCAGYVVGRVGDVIALAIGGRDFEPPQVVNAVAWIQGVPPQRIGIETVTIADVYMLVGRPMPDPLPMAAAAPRTSPVLPVLIAAGSIALLLAGGFVLFRASR